MAEQLDLDAIEATARTALAEVVSTGRVRMAPHPSVRAQGALRSMMQGIHHAPSG